MLKKVDYLTVLTVMLLGAFGEYLVPVSLTLGIIWALVFLFGIGKSGSEIEYPRGYSLYALFVLSTLVSLPWSLDLGNSLLGELTLLALGLVWVAFYNAQNVTEDLFVKFIIFISIYLGFIYIANVYLKFVPETALSLLVVEPVYRNHSYLGDLWALVVVFFLTKIIAHGRYRPLMLFIGFVLVTLSQSRAALISIAGGAMYLIVSGGNSFKVKNTGIVFFVIALLVVALGSFKSLFFARADFLQSTMLLNKNIFGIGWGNLHIADPNINTEVVHNLVLQMLSAFGVFAIPFVAWLIVIVRNIFGNSRKSASIYVLSFIVLGINFLVGLTFAIPTLLLLWAASLGLAQKSFRS